MLSDQTLVTCPHCGHTVEIALKTVRRSAILTCEGCSRVYALDKDAITLVVVRRDLADDRR